MYLEFSLLLIVFKAQKMDENTVAEINNEILEVSNLLWGPTVKADVFRRWAQGKLGSALLFTFFLTRIPC